MLGVVALVVASLACRPGSASVALSGDNQAFTVTYSDFVVQGAEAKKSCTIEVRLSHAEGYTYGIAQTDHRGFAHLTEGTRGTQRNTYRFPGFPTQHSTTTYQAPMSDNWQVTDVPSKVQHGPCKERRPLTIEAELKVAGKGSATSLMTLDSTDSSVSTTFRLSWQRCTAE
jgi:hypothetical protein